MKRVGPAPADVVEHRAAKSVLRREGRRGDLNFRDALEDRIVDVSAGGQAEGGAGGGEVGVVGKVAVYGNSVSGVIRAAALRSGLRGRTGCPGKKDIEISPIVTRDPCADLGQLIYGLFVENRSLLAGLGLQERRTGIFDVHHVRYLAHGKARVHGNNRHLQHDGAAPNFLKSGLRERKIALSM